MKKRNAFIIMIISIILMFFWIFLTVFLTDGKELYDFSKRDWNIFSAFICIELLTVAAMFFSLFKFIINAQISNVVSTKRQKKSISKSKSNTNTKNSKRNIVLTILAYVLSFSISIIGIVVAENISPTGVSTAKTILLISVVLFIATFPISILANIRYSKKYNDMKVAEIQNYIYSQRDATEDAIKNKLNFLKRCRIFTDYYALFFSVFGIIIAFCCGVSYNASFHTLFWLLSAFCFLCSFTRIRFPIPATIFDENASYISEKDYPTLYALVYKAANQLNCSAPIRIAFTDDFNAGIAKIGKLYSVQIGVLLLNALSQEELYSVLLHEFGHMGHENGYYSQKDYDYNNWLLGEGTISFLSEITQLPFLFFNTVYTLNYSLYLYTISIQVEHFADKNMIQHCNTQYAASALLKSKYFDLHTWEQTEIDFENIFQSEQLNKSFTRKKIQSFKEALKTRISDWNKLIDNEILSRSASHPTFKMRMNALGVSSYSIYESENSDTYIAECLKSSEYVDELIYKQNVDDYHENRKELYLEPKQLVDTWVSSGKPIIPEEYMDIISALRQLGRISEADILCDSAISMLDDIVSCHAYFVKGCSLLHKYDPSGIDYIYHAIENNSNYIMEGLNTIGEFCCIVGREDDLQIYRKKALELVQRHKDIYSEYSTLNKSDYLVTEQLPEQLFNDTLSFILSTAQNQIKKIYLVRKVVTEHDFTSVFVIHFDESIPPETQDKLIHKIFTYLDTCSSWQFSLFNYLDVSNIKFNKVEGSCIYSK